MALDAVTYDRVEEAEKNILDGIGKKLDQPINDIETAIDNFEKIASSLPSGVPAPSLSSISSSSNEEGIDVTLTANVKSYEQSNESFVLSRTDGVMVRYKEDSFPVNKEDGTLAFVDTDLFTVGSNGEITPKQKTNRVVGLTNGKTYYFTAFPYSTQNVYNESAGSKNCTKCQWTGTKGTLTVNVTQDYDYKPLGEYTATMTPTSGGQAITKTQSGAATIVFSGFEAGEYTLSFSDVASFTKPQNQSVTVVAGQSQVLDLQYQLNVSLSSLSWADIDEYAQMGVANQIFSVGDTKDVSVNGETITFEIVGFNHDYLSDGSGKAKITFGMKNLMGETRYMNKESTNVGSYEGSSMNDYVSGNFYSSLPSDLRSIIKSVKKVTSNGGGSESETRTDIYNTWLFSEQEVFGIKKNSSGNEGSKYEIFTSSSSMIKKLSNGSGRAYDWWLRSPNIKTSNHFCVVGANGSSSTSSSRAPLGVCVGFCI